MVKTAYLTAFREYSFSSASVLASTNSLRRFGRAMAFQRRPRLHIVKRRGKMEGERKEEVASPSPIRPGN